MLILTELDEFAEEVRDFLRSHLTEDLCRAGALCAGIYADKPIAQAWMRILATRGWSVPAWPTSHGGTGWSLRQLYIFQRELAAAEAPPITPNATGMLGPVVIAFGDENQKARILPGIRSGDDWWAQGYSEPQAGSDLAQLQCRAVRDGGDYVINGTKIWTTHAQWSDHIFCLVRTDTGGKPQQGISFLMFELNQPGVRIEPITSISGDHELNQVFFDEVRVPLSARLGEENDGWRIAKYLLQHERSTPLGPMLQVRLNRLRHLLQRTAAPEPALPRRLEEAQIAIDALANMELNVLALAESGGSPGLYSSAIKILQTEARQRTTELGIELAGEYALVQQKAVRDAWHTPLPAIGPRDYLPLMPQYLNDRAASIYAGSNEVQRNIIARSILGL